MRDGRPKLGQCLALLLLLCFSAWTLAPFVILVGTSFSATGIATASGATQFTLDNYRAAVSDTATDLAGATRFSLLLASAVTFLSLLLGCPAAYALARGKGRWATAVANWIFSTRFLPPVVAAIPLFVAFRILGIAGNPAGLMLLDLLVALPFVVWVLRSYLTELPPSLEELAVVDGLGPRGALLHAVLPSVRAPLLAVAAMTWLFTWNEYFFGLLFSGTDRPVTVVIASWNTYQGVQWGPACAAGVLAAVPAVLLLVVSVRFLSRGFGFGWKAETEGPW